MNLIWTKHAMARVSERFPTEAVRPPTGLIQLIAMHKPDGESFRVRHGDVVFVCQREGDAIIMLTIIRRDRESTRLKPARNRGRTAKVQNRRVDKGWDDVY